MMKYAFNYHGDGDMPSDPAEIEAVMQAWSAWIGELVDAVVDGVNPFGAVASVATDGSVAHVNPARLTGSLGRQRGPPRRCDRHGEGLPGARGRRFGVGQRDHRHVTPRPRRDRVSRDQLSRNGTGSDAAPVTSTIMSVSTSV